MVSLTRTGKTRAAIDNMVVTVLALDDGRLRSAGDVAKALDAFFGLSISDRDVQRSVDTHLLTGRLVRQRHSSRLTLATPTLLEIMERIEASKALETAVKAEWSIELRAEGLASDEADLESLWSCLRCYMAKAFCQHGALTVQLLDPRVLSHDAELTNLSTCMDGAISEGGFGSDRGRARAALSSFFKTTTLARARYIAQLLDATFTFFALTVNDATAAYLKESLTPLALFLDTNYIFGLLGIHENPLSEASKELISFIRDHGFPFTLYVHERTIKEIQATMAAVSDRLLGRHWTPALSRAALATRTGTGVELTFHRLNAQHPLDPKVYLSKFDHIIDLLTDHGVKLYRVPQHEGYTLEQKGQLIAEYAHYVDQWRPGKPKPYDALDHDICVWLTLQTKRTGAASALDTGALLLSNDVLFRNFDWRVLRDGSVGSVVLPGQLLQVLRPFVAATDDFDRRFVEAFAAPEFRTAQSDYEETNAKVLSYLTTYKDVPEKTAVRILTNEMLIHRLQGAEEGSEEFKELIDSALVQDNAALLEEREALHNQLERERLTREEELAEANAALAARDAELTKSAAVLEERAAEVRAEERHKADAEKAELLVQERQRHHELLQAASEEAKRSSGLAEELARERRHHHQFRIGAAVVLCLVGWAMLLVVPHATGWMWLHRHDHRNGVYGFALLAWGGVSWTVAEPKHYRGSLGLVVLGALLAGIALI
jgi:hypothetical protein